jgi:hypothetical protein
MLRARRPLVLSALRHAAERRTEDIHMSAYRVNKLLFDLQMQPELWEEFTKNPQKVADQYRLSPEEAAAVINVDATAMSRLGVQPYLLRFYTVRRGMSNEELIRQLELA